MENQVEMVEVVNNDVSERERALAKGELNIEFIGKKMITYGISSLKDYEMDVVKETIMKLEPNAIINEDKILEYHKLAKIKYFNELCEENIVNGFLASNGHFYRTNRDDQTNMIGQKDMINSVPTIETVMWKTEDAGYIEHTTEEWLQVYTEAFIHKQNQLFKYAQLKEAIMMATTHEQVDAIKWE